MITFLLFVLCLGLLAFLYLMPVWSKRPHFEVLVCAFVYTFLFMGTVAQAGAPPTPTTATVSWTRATTMLDGALIPVTNHKETWVRWYRAASPTVTIGEIRVPYPAQLVVVNDLVCGDYVFVAHTVIQNVPVASATSNPSNEAIKATGVVCTPNPPTGLTTN